MEGFDIQLNALPFGSCPAARCEENEKGSEVIFSDIWPPQSFGESDGIMPQFDTKLDIPVIRSSEKQDLSSGIDSPDSGFWSIGSLERGFLNGKSQFDSKSKRSSENLEMSSDTGSSESGSLNGKPQFYTRLDSPGMAGSEKQNIWSEASTVESDSLHGNSENQVGKERVFDEAKESSPKVKLRETKVETKGEEKHVNAFPEGGRGVANGKPQSLQRNSKDITENGVEVEEKGTERKKRPLSSSIRSIQARFSAPAPPQDTFTSKRNSQELTANQRKRDSAELKHTSLVRETLSPKPTATQDHSIDTKREAEKEAFKPEGAISTSVETGVKIGDEKANWSNVDKENSAPKVTADPATQPSQLEDNSNLVTADNFSLDTNYNSRVEKKENSRVTIKGNSSMMTQDISSLETRSQQTESLVMTVEKRAVQGDQNNSEDKSEKKKRPLSSSIRAIQARLLNSCPNEVAQESLKPKKEAVKAKQNRGSDSQLEEKLKNPTQEKKNPEISDKPEQSGVGQLQSVQKEPKGPSSLSPTASEVITGDLPQTLQDSMNGTASTEQKNAREIEEPKGPTAKTEAIKFPQKEDKMEMFEATVICQTSSRNEPTSAAEEIKSSKTFMDKSAIEKISTEREENTDVAQEIKPSSIEKEVAPTEKKEVALEALESAQLSEKGQTTCLQNSAPAEKESEVTEKTKKKTVTVSVKLQSVSPEDTIQTNKEGQVPRSDLATLSNEPEVQKKVEENVQEAVNNTELALKDETVSVEDSMPMTENKAVVAEKKLLIKDPTTKRKEKKVDTKEDAVAKIEPSVSHINSEELIPTEKEYVPTNECKMEMAEAAVKHETSGPKDLLPTEKESEVAKKTQTKEATPEEVEKKVAGIPKEDTLGMIEQRRRATQERIQAHLKGLDKSEVQREEKKNVKRDSFEEETTKICDAKQQKDKEHAVEKPEPGTKCKTSVTEEEVVEKSHSNLSQEDNMSTKEDVEEKTLSNLSKEPMPEKEKKNVTKNPIKEDTVVKTVPTITHKTFDSQVDKETEVAEANTTKEEATAEKEEKKETPTEEVTVEIVQPTHSPKTYGSEDLNLAEGVAEKNLTNEQTSETDEKKVVQVSTNGELVASRTCASENLMPTEVDTKLEQKKQHRQIKKATRRRDENTTGTEAAPEEKEKKDVESPTKEDSVKSPAGKITFVPEVLIQAEKEVEVTKKKVANLTKEPTPKKEKKNVEQGPESSTSSGEKTEVADIKIKEIPHQEKRNVAIKSSPKETEIVEHGKKEAFSDSITHEPNLPKKDKVSDESQQIDPKEKEKNETTEEQEETHLPESRLAQQDAQKNVDISIEESTIQDGNVDVLVGNVALKDTDISIEESTMQEGNVGVLVGNVAQKNTDISIKESTMQEGSVNVLVEKSDVAQKKGEAEQCLPERKTEEPNISKLTAEKGANDSNCEQMHPKERTEEKVGGSSKQKEDTKLNFQASQENPSSSSQNEKEPALKLQVKSKAEETTVEKDEEDKLEKSEEDIVEKGEEDIVEKGEEDKVAEMSRINSGSSNESCTRRTDATNELPERETKRKKKKKRSDRMSKDVEINFEELLCSKQEFSSDTNKDAVLSFEPKALSPKPDVTKQKKESSDDSKEKLTLAEKESEQKQGGAEKERSATEKEKLKMESDENEKSKESKLEDEGEENEKSPAKTKKLKRRSHGENVSKDADDSKQEDSNKNVNQTKQSKIKRRSCPVERSEESKEIEKETGKKEVLVKSSELEETESRLKQGGGGEHKDERKLKRRSYPGESLVEGAHRRSHTRDDSNSKVNRRRRERRASRENNSRHSSADNRATRRSLDISTDEKTIRRRSTGETSQKKLRRKSKKVAETEKPENTNDGPIVPCEEKVDVETKENETECKDEKTLNGENEDESITVDIKKDTPDVTEEKLIVIKNTESEDKEKVENIGKEEKEQAPPCKPEAPTSFRETVQKQVVGVIENALGMIGIQSKVDESESLNSAAAQDLPTNGSCESKEPKPEPVKDKPQVVQEEPTRQKRITLPIIYKNRSAADMFKKKSFSVKVSEEKLNLRRQEKPRSPTPEPPPCKVEANTVVAKPVKETKTIREKIDEQPETSLQSEPKKEEEKIESPKDQDSIEQENDNVVLEDQFEGETELNEENFIKLVCEKRSQIKSLEKKAQGINKSKKKQIEDLQGKGGKLDDQAKSFGTQLSEIDSEMKKLVARKEHISLLSKENKRERQSLFKDETRVEEERSAELMENKREMSERQQELLVLITMKPELNVANEEKIVMPKLTLVDIYDRRIEAKASELECPVCSKTASIPIFMCQGHHLICSSCILKVPSCPRCQKSFPLGEGRRNRKADMAAEELAALIKERKEVARRSGHAVNGEDNGDENGQEANEENNSNETSSLDHESNDPQREEDCVVVSEKANRVGSDVKQKAENRLSFDPDRWNLKVPQGIPPHIAQSAFELYDQELRNMPDREFKEFLKDWSPNSPMYLYLRELRRKVR